MSRVLLILVALPAAVCGLRLEAFPDSAVPLPHASEAAPAPKTPAVARPIPGSAPAGCPPAAQAAGSGVTTAPAAQAAAPAAAAPDVREVAQASPLPASLNPSDLPSALR